MSLNRSYQHIGHLKKFVVVTFGHFSTILIQNTHSAIQCQRVLTSMIPYVRCVTLVTQLLNQFKMSYQNSTKLMSQKQLFPLLIFQVALKKELMVLYLSNLVKKLEHLIQFQLGLIIQIVIIQNLLANMALGHHNLRAQLEIFMPLIC